ncbi:MAG: adenine phosphoribosyltransferase [Candidatus Omnitrophica bacterium]|nr:adenine phosphoribosyltransferase [Candidatus Omnitrophota bacterium]
MKAAEKLKAAIRDIPDFPKKGIIFKDITPLLQDARLFSETIEALAACCRDKPIDAIACVEARGFVFGAVLAHTLNVGLVLIRKKGKLPYATHQVSYDLEYGTDTLEVHQDAVKAGASVLVVDDVLATGGTIAAVYRLMEKLEAKVAGALFLIELSFLHGREKIKKYPVEAVITY